MKTEGRIAAISISRHRRIKKTNVERAKLVEDFGIEGDAHAGKWIRQVSLMSLTSIQKMAELGLEVKPGGFAENITTDGIDLLELPAGTRLELGEGALVEITQIGKVCHKPCSIYYQVGACIFPTEGIFARVISGGEIRVGDKINVVEDEGAFSFPRKGGGGGERAGGRRMISVEEAQKIILENASPAPPARVALMDALGLVLAEDISAAIDLPPFTSSAMDGFAVRSRDTTQAGSTSPVTLQIAEHLPAGKVPRRNIASGFCAGIMTGGVLPEGADAVIPVEEAETLGEESIRICRPVSTGEHVRYQGEDVKEGKLLLEKGRLVRPQEMALIAALGYERVPVFPRPNAAVLSTGDELIPVSAKLTRGKIRDSNSYALEALLRKEEVSVTRLGIAKDDLADLRKKIKRGMRFDLLLVAGGVSVGTHDLVKQVFREEGIKELFWKVNMKPGKPVFFGKIGSTLVFGLPGNPASSFVSFELVVRPALRKLMGKSEILPRFQKAVLEHDLAHQAGRVDFIRAAAERKNGTYVVRSSGTQGSHCLSSLAKSNALIRLDEKVSRVQKGEEIEVILL